jgi:hypothetical protein
MGGEVLDLDSGMVAPEADSTETGIAGGEVVDVQVHLEGLH